MMIFLIPLTALKDSSKRVGSSTFSIIWTAVWHEAVSQAQGYALLECTGEVSHSASADWVRTGLISTTGVPSIASIGPTFTFFLVISRTVTRCKPSGFGRSGDRVAKTPAKGTVSSPRGCTFKMSR
jgi:hypothetical protein